MRATRDLVPRRMFLVRRRSELLQHVQLINQQYDCDSFGKIMEYAANRDGFDRFEPTIRVVARTPFSAEGSAIVWLIGALRKRRLEQNGDPRFKRRPVAPRVVLQAFSGSYRAQLASVGRTDAFPCGRWRAQDTPTLCANAGSARHPPQRSCFGQVKPPVAAHLGPLLLMGRT